MMGRSHQGGVDCRGLEELEEVSLAEDAVVELVESCTDVGGHVARLLGEGHF